MYKAYPAILHPSDDGGYWVEFPDLPGCFSQGETLADTIAEASTALGAYLCSCDENSVAYQPPSDIHSLSVTSPDIMTVIASDPNAFRTRTRAVKKTLTIPEWLNDEAEKNHLNFSAVLQEALIARLQ